MLLKDDIKINVLTNNVINTFPRGRGRVNYTIVLIQQTKWQVSISKKEVIFLSYSKLVIIFKRAVYHSKLFEIYT